MHTRFPRTCIFLSRLSTVVFLLLVATSTALLPGKVNAAGYFFGTHLHHSGFPYGSSLLLQPEPAASPDGNATTTSSSATATNGSVTCSVSSDGTGDATAEVSIAGARCTTDVESEIESEGETESVQESSEGEGGTETEASETTEEPAEGEELLNIQIESTASSENIVYTTSYEDDAPSAPSFPPENIADLFTLELLESLPPSVAVYILLLLAQ